MVDMSTYIKFNPSKLKALKKAYARAVKDEQSMFFFEGVEFYTLYAKYLIEYLEIQFNKKS